MADKIKYSEEMVMVILRHEIGSRNPAEQDIKTAINKAALLLPMTDSEKIAIEKIIQARMQVRMDLGTQIVDPVTYHPWVASRRASITPYYWNRYRDYLFFE